MPAQHIYKLAMEPKVWIRDGVPMYSGPVFMYEVEGTPNTDFQIVNTSAQHREPTWRIRRVVTDVYAGEYRTPKEALAALEQRVNE